MGTESTNTPAAARDISYRAGYLAGRRDEQHGEGLAEPAPGSSGEARFNWALIGDVFDVLAKHGYSRGDNQHVGRAVGILGDLVETYEGTGR
jgi:hypothetical protein